MTWDVKRTRSLIDRAFGRGQLQLARPAIKSVSDRLDYANYHYREAMRLTKEFAGKYLTNQPLLAVALSSDNDERHAFEELMTQLGAHTIACVQSIHALPDILSHMLYFSLGLNRGSALEEQRVEVRAVCKLLKRRPKYVEFADALESMVSEDAFAHVSALANHSRHRSIVQPQLNEDLTGLRADRHEVRFSSFNYLGKSFPVVGVRALLEPAYASCSQIVVGTGETLNRTLSASVVANGR